MTSKDFNKQCSDILTSAGAAKEGDYYIIDTIYGRLQLRPDPSPRIKVYSLFARFIDSERMNVDHFKEWILSGFDSFNRFSFKWNLHDAGPEFIINELEERLDNLKYLETL